MTARIIEEDRPRFTPGPWSYRPQRYDDWGTVRGAPDSDGHQWMICQARSPYKTRGQLSEHRIDGTDPWEATARLISAAPDMYEALADEDLEACLYAWVNEKGIGRAEYDRRSALIDRRIAALTKARGQ